MSASRPLRLTLLALTWASALVFAWLSLSLVASDLGLGVDSHAYWSAWRGSMYDAAPATRDAFLYSPAFAQAVWLPTRLPWPIFGVLWSGAAALTIVWLAAGSGRAWVVPLSLFGTFEVLTGNVNWLLALVVVLGWSRPGLWVVPLLTKITPALGPLWFLVRREWRNLGVTVAWSAGSIVVSYVLSPDLWHQWWHFVTTYGGRATGEVGSSLMPPLTLRLPVVVALVAWGALSNRAWVVPVGMVLASPVSGLGQFVVLLALPRLLARERAAAQIRTASPTRSSLRP